MQGAEQIAFIHKDESAGRSLVELMRAAGFDAVLFGSIEAFHRARTFETASCVVIDDQLTTDCENSFAALRESNMKFILLSVREEEDARRRAHELGAAAFFREPVDGEALLDVIRWELISRT